MTDILGYGEDSLTFYYLKTGWNEIKQKIKEKVVSKTFDLDVDCEIFYRLSFGRGQWMGEFDAAVVASGVAVLIESKWGNSVPRDSKVCLRPEQWLRHSFLEDLILKGQGRKWEGLKEIFPKEFPKSQGTTLQQNLMMFLGKCKDKKVREVINVLLFFKTGGDKCDHLGWKPLEPKSKDEVKKLQNNRYRWKERKEKIKFTVIPLNVYHDEKVPMGFIKL